MVFIAKGICVITESTASDSKLKIRRKVHAENGTRYNTVEQLGGHYFEQFLLFGESQSRDWQVATVGFFEAVGDDLDGWFVQLY